MKTGRLPDERIDTFCRLTRNERSQLNLFKGDRAKNEELEKVIKAMPLISVTSAAQPSRNNDGSEPLTIKIDVKYDNLPDNQEPGYVHSAAYPDLKKHSLYVIVTDKIAR